jgi:hypothetical protein
MLEAHAAPLENDHMTGAALATPPARPRKRRPARTRRVLRAPLLTAIPLLLFVGCGLLPQDPIGFRSYPLQGVDYAEAVSIVQTATRDVCTERFGGVTLTWFPEDGNLTVDPIFAGNRRLRLYIHVEPAGSGVNVEMFALVDHLLSGTHAIGFTEPMQDVPLEETLAEAFVAELLRRREAGS